MINNEARKSEAKAWFEALRDRICDAFELIEEEFAKGASGDLMPGRFERNAWTRKAKNDDPDSGPAGAGVQRLCRIRTSDREPVRNHDRHRQLERRRDQSQTLMGGFTILV